MARLKLTDLAIRNLPLPDKGNTKHWDTSTPGFGVRCSPNVKSFVVMYGRDRKLKTLGKWPSVSLREARQQAKMVLATPDNRSRSMTLSEARRAYLDDCYSRLRKSTADRYSYALKDLRPSKPDPTTLRTLKGFYTWCVRRGITDHNPYEHEKVSFRERERLLNAEEIALIWNYDYPPYSDLVKLLLLTGQRRAQIHALTEEWIVEDTITFPASVMKSKRPHTIPLSPLVAGLIADRTAFNSWSKAKVRIDKHTGMSGWVLHDIRRYFSTTMAQLGMPLHITEQIIDHRSQVTGVAAIYNRYSFLTEMRDALSTYEAHIAKIVST